MNKFYIDLGNRYISKMYLYDTGYQISFTNDLNKAKTFTQDEINQLKKRKVFPKLRQIPKEGD